MSFVSPATQSPNSAPTPATLTEIITASGIIQLSYCATRKRYENNSANPNTHGAWPADACSCSEIPDQLKVYPAGSVRLATSAMAVNASPELRPAPGCPLMLTAGN